MGLFPNIKFHMLMITSHYEIKTCLWCTSIYIINDPPNMILKCPVQTMYQMDLGLPAMQAASSSSRSRPPGRPGSSSPLCSFLVAHQGFHPLVPVGIEIYITIYVHSMIFFLIFKNAPKVHNCLTVWFCVQHASGGVLEGLFKFPNDPLVRYSYI